MRGVILYGPPASGKDTVTHALENLDPRYRLYRRLKVGEGRTDGYRMSTQAEVDELRRRGEIVWENRRYGSLYVVDRPALLANLATHYPVVHLGQVEAVRAVATATVSDAAWCIVSLWCPREIAAKRLRGRGSPDVAERLAAWDQTQPLDGADLTINTAVDTPEQAATQVHAQAPRP